MTGDDDEDEEKRGNENREERCGERAGESPTAEKRCELSSGFAFLTSLYKKKFVPSVFLY